MANEKQTIRTITEPTIVLDDLQSFDAESGEAPELGGPETAYKPSKQYGAVAPLIQVNDYPFPVDSIMRMSIDCVSDRPTISVTILIRDKSFYSTSYPKDGDLVSVFIRGKVDPLKPIRNDYDITNVSVVPATGNTEDDYDMMYISGVLRIPGYDALKCFSVKGTSMKALLKVATDLNLGFATNEVDTADSQTWICPFEKTKNFISEIALASWKDENSFFTYFIDHYYYLNFVNVEPLYSDLPEIETAVATLRLSNDYGTDNELAKSEVQSVLSNWDDIDQSQFYIGSHQLINNTASINLTHGYKRYSQIYDGLLKEEQTFFIDPKTTEGSENDKQLLKGRPRENFYLAQINGKWMGVQYGKDGENSHPKYNYARVTNYQNMVHLEKMGIRITLANNNFNLRRFQVVPVIIMIKKDFVRKRYNEPIDESQEKTPATSQSTVDAQDSQPKPQSAVDFNETPFVIDKTMSGYYTIHNISYIYENGKMFSTLELYRREWPTPPQTY
jgi:hypothetical protein